MGVWGETFPAKGTARAKPLMTSALMSDGGAESYEDLTSEYKTKTLPVISWRNFRHAGASL